MMKTDKIPEKGDIAFMEEYGPGMFIEVVEVRTKAVRKKRKIGGTFWKPVMASEVNNIVNKAIDSLNQLRDKWLKKETSRC